MISVSHIILPDHVIKGSCDVMGNQVSYHRAKFGGLSHSGSGDIMFLVCHVISKDHVIKGSCDFMSKRPLL